MRSREIFFIALGYSLSSLRDSSEKPTPWKDRRVAEVFRFSTETSEFTPRQTPTRTPDNARILTNPEDHSHNLRTCVAQVRAAS